jgi:hypothetical protein
MHRTACSKISLDSLRACERITIGGLAVITEPADRRHWRQIDDGAIGTRSPIPISTRKPRCSTLWSSGGAPKLSTSSWWPAKWYTRTDGSPVDRDAALRELHQSLQRPLAEDEVQRRRLSKALLPHVRRF